MFRNIQCKCNVASIAGRKTTNEIIVIEHTHTKEKKTRDIHISFESYNSPAWTFTLTNETCNIKQFVNEHSFACQFDSHVKTSNLIWMNDKFHGEDSKKTRTQTRTRGASELVNAFYVELLFPFVFSLVFSMEPNHMHAAQLHTFTFWLICTHTHTQTHQCHADQVPYKRAVVRCVFPVRIVLFIKWHRETTTISPL